jgi:hypothetical protein
MMELKRIAIYSKDIQKITGKSDRYARKVMRIIRQKLGKEKHNLVSVSELCEYLDIREEEVIKLLEQ